ncbi:uncharacterized protein F5891DRAFT_1214238 [Suillus fuscotomentosus]|uniref:Uncharacterized protein n=1 Tax=Suillus fuscotomentosus TaxID=1912939 RepID=A0AAD4EB61_9AGAM|nr:uncharacterized protein F5891DRAFT_1214238 [Suillus fuscotomentosus]KAG1902917.1 hypothetical protein F5891DRAFT_1214238 [Suillus fuscotomentosus]
MAAIFGSSTSSSRYYYTRTRKSEVKTDKDTKMVSKPSTATPWLKSNPTSKSKVQSLSPTSKPVLSNQADIVTTSCKPKEAEPLATESLVNSLNNVIVSIGKCADTIIDALQHVQVEPMCFSNVSFDEFVTVLDSISGDDMHLLKAKMTYFPRTMVLIIYSPHPVHDQTTSEISSAISSELRSLSFMRSLLMDIFTIPDMQLTLTPTTSEAAETEVLWYMETVFSQSKCVALKKIEKVLIAYPEIICILFILISKQTHYETPSDNSPTYSQALANKSLRPYTSFSPHRDAEKLFGPIKAMDHKWINVSKVEYFVWLKEGNDVINVNGPHVAYGTLFPNLDMGQINTLQPAVDHTNLLAPSAIVFYWETDVTFVSVAVYKTAHFRYCDWYHRNFSGTKHRRMNNGGDEAEPERPSNRRVITSASDNADDTGLSLTSTSASTSTSGSSSSGQSSSSGESSSSAA